MGGDGAPWLEASEVVPMFPTFVWKLLIHAQRREAMDARLLAALQAMRQERVVLARGQGWQSPQDLHQREEFGDLVACVLHAAAGVLRFLSIGYDALQFTGCWATILAPGAEHRAHGHPNNFLSGVYYLRTFHGADTINFHDPRPQTGIIRPPVVELSAANTDQVVVRVQNGSLLLFPSYLQHSVDANAGEAERISVSFNLMFSGFTEQLSKPLW